MPLTRAAVEAEIVDRIGPRLAFMGMSVIVDGTNPSLNGPIRRALAFLGYATAEPLVVTDTDLAQLTPTGSTSPARDGWRIERLCDLACLQALQSILFKTTDEQVDWKAGVDEAKASQFVARLAADIAALEAKVAEPFGPDVPSIVVGSMLPDPARLPNDPFDPCRTRSTRGNWPYP